MKYIAITGSTGFVGKYLLAHLNVLDHSAKALTRKDLSKSEHVFSGVNYVLHLAGKAHDLKKTSNPNEYYDVNYELTKKLYNSFLKSSAEKFIFISSVKASADSVSDVLTEDSKAAPLTDYGKSKLMAEEYIQSQLLPPGKSYYILRPCMIHGPGNKGNLNLLYKMVQKRLPYPLAAFQNQRSFLSISNLNLIIERLVRNDIESGVYNVADDQPLSTNEVIQIIAEALDFKQRFWKVNPGFIAAIAKIGDRLSLPLNSERLQKLTESYVVSNQKIKNALGIHKFPVSSKEGLLSTIRSFTEL